MKNSAIANLIKQASFSEFMVLGLFVSEETKPLDANDVSENLGATLMADGETCHHYLVALEEIGLLRSRMERGRPVYQMPSTVAAVYRLLYLSEDGVVSDAPAPRVRLASFAS